MITSAPPHFGLDGTIACAGRVLPTALAAPAAVARAGAALAMVPASLTSWLYFECRLSGDCPPVDVSLRVEAGQRGWLATAGATALPGGADLQRIAGWWATADGAAIARLWLEFDVPAGGAGALPAGVFLEVAPDARRAAATLLRASVALAAVERLIGRALDASDAVVLRRCFGCLPPHAEAVYLGHFAHRTREAVRLSVMGLRDDEIVSYLRAVAWPGDVDALAATLAGVAHHARGRPSVGVVNLDVAHGAVLPRLGFEYLLDRAPQLRGTLPDAPLLDHLVAAGLCDPARRAALACWPGHTCETLPHEIWPSLVVRRVNHVKIVCDAHGPTEAKAYLAYAHMPRVARRPGAPASA